MLKDPRLLNFLLMLIYTLNVFRWGMERNLDALYWLGALLITIAVTFK